MTCGPGAGPGRLFKDWLFKDWVFVFKELALEAEPSVSGVAKQPTPVARSHGSGDVLATFFR